jgi:multidrug resistance protein MdtO
LASNLHLVSGQPSDVEAERIRHVSQHIRKYAEQLQAQQTIEPGEQLPASVPSQSLPLLPEVEVTVKLLEQAFAAPHFEAGEEIHRLEPDPKFRLFPPGVLTNHEYHVFALRGWIPACLCYVFYNAVDWPGISTCLATCIITALSNVGSSRQKQLLRLAGAIVGGFLISMPAQILILPNLDSITGFAIFFAIVTAIAGWFATSSPRLSYFGMQIALAFYLINLQDFQVQTSLSVARDRVMGVMVGLFAMWLIFDRLWAPRATEQIPKLFAEVLRLLARLATRPVDTDRPAAVREIRELRDRINASLLNFNSQMDAVQFEFGPEREQNLKLREKMQKVQPALRSIYLLEITLHQYRTRPGVDAHVSESTRRVLDQFLRAYATSLDCIAEAFEGGSHFDEEQPVEQSERRLEAELEQHSDWQDALAVERICRQMIESLRSLPKACLS